MFLTCWYGLLFTTDRKLRSLLSVGGHFDGTGCSKLVSQCESFLKLEVNWNTVGGAFQDLPWHNIRSADNPVEVLNEHLSLLVGRHVQTKVIRVRNKYKPWFDDQCRSTFDLRQESHLRWTRYRSRVNWEEFVHCQVRANET